VRLYGHAGADLPTTYISREEVEAEEANDPAAAFVRLLARPARWTPMQALAIYPRDLRPHRPHRGRGRDAAAAQATPPGHGLA
jgi:hypothetical protein